jgi:oxygen-dependent protoporphyrinogen oxidase
METSTRPAVVAVIGGGISGLSAAYYLLRAAREFYWPLQVVVIERDLRLGGKIRTDTIGVGESPFILEGGPDAFLAQKPWAANLARDLGLGEELMPICPMQPATSILVHGRPLPLPEGLRLISPTKLVPFLTSPIISPWGKVDMLLDLVRPARGLKADESLADFVRARLGREALDRLAEPLMAGIYSGDPEKQSMLATFPQFREAEERHGSVICGTRQAAARSSTSSSPFLTLQRGMGSLIDALTSELEGHLWRGRRALWIAPAATPRSGYQVHLDDSTTFMADGVIVATPAYTAAELVESWQPKLAAKLRRIPYISTGTISLAYSKAAISRPFAGFGLVIPRSEGRLLNAVTICSAKFTHRAPADQVLIRVFFGGYRNSWLVEADDAELLMMAVRELYQLMGIRVPPRFAKVYRWRDASPQYYVGHQVLRQEIADLVSSLPRLALCGPAYEGVGIPDSVRLAQNAAEQILGQIEDSRASSFAFQAGQDQVAQD